MPGATIFPMGWRQVRKPVIRRWKTRRCRSRSHPAETLVAGHHRFQLIRRRFSQAIDETSNYYLLAWRPASDDQRAGKSKIKVIIKDRPELRVRCDETITRPRFLRRRKRLLLKKVTANSRAITGGGLLSALGTLYATSAPLHVGRLHEHA